MLTALPFAQLMMIADLLAMRIQHINRAQPRLGLLLVLGAFTQVMYILHPLDLWTRNPPSFTPRWPIGQPIQKTPGPQRSSRHDQPYSRDR